MMSLARNYRAVITAGRLWLLPLCLLGLPLASCSDDETDLSLIRQLSQLNRANWQIHSANPAEKILGQELRNGYRNTDKLVISIISDYFGIHRDKITLETHLVDNLEANSLNIVEIVMELEEQFNVNIPKEGEDRIANVGDAVDYIRGRVKQRIEDVEHFHDELLSMARTGRSVPPIRELKKTADSYDLRAYLSLGIVTIDERTSTLAKISTIFCQSPKYWPIVFWMNQPTFLSGNLLRLSIETEADTELEVGKDLWVLYLWTK